MKCSPPFGRSLVVGAACAQALSPHPTDLRRATNLALATTVRAIAES
ncbi:MAG: hypothetical protein F6J93_38790 [Oscillatoria sp. SIO1A7]|nr:hypothetical protein [Oscillatoria sp. SIO1A7]